MSERYDGNASIRERIFASGGYRRTWHSLLNACDEPNYELRVALIEGAMVDLVDSAVACFESFDQEEQAGA